MQIVRKKENIGQMMFLTAILIELLIMMTDHSAVTLPFRGRVSHVAFLLFGGKILTTDYSKKEWAVIVLFGLLGAVSYLTCRDELIVRMVVMVAASKNIDVKKIGKWIFYVSLTGTLVIVGLSLVGILGQAVDVRHYGRGVEEARWCLGFSHANNVHNMAWYLLSLFLLLYGEKCNWKHYLALTAGNAGLFLLTVSRTGFITVQLLIVFAVAIKYVPVLNQKIWLPLCSVAGMAACMYLTMLAGMNGWHSEFVYFCDRFLTGRLEMIWEHAPVHEWVLFPADRTALYVDNGFAVLFYCYGIVVGIIYLTCILWMIYSFYRKERGVEQVVLMTVVLTTFMESTFIFNTSLLCNIMLVLMFTGIWKVQKETV